MNGNDLWLEKVKLIIWDMDNTFWRGTLTEGEVVCPEENFLLIKLLTAEGIINSISSKNDEKDVLERLNQIEQGFSSYFVFNNINWSDKGRQINDKLIDMNLRAENVLFIDDNARNLEEAVACNPGLMVAGPEVIADIIAYVSSSIDERGQVKDPNHTRLNQYKVLEERKDCSKNYSTNEQFLYDSNIVVDIDFSCLDHIERILELVERTNQLNFTKNRSSRFELEKQLTSDWNRCACISVRDKFGDYGIVGFFCYNRLEKRMEHFLFSCRVLGMQIEQYVYARMGYPVINIVEPVASKLENGKVIDWIYEDTTKTVLAQTAQKKGNRVRVLLKGPCDLSAIEQYLQGGSITTEFNFVNNNGFITTGQNHSTHIFEGNVLSDDEKDKLLRDAPFLIREDFETMIFRNEYNVICYSMLSDCHAGLYQHKETGLYASFGSVNFDLTDESNWNGYISGNIPNHFYPFTEEVLREFSSKWQFVGTTPDEVLLYNLEYIYENMVGSPILILLLGSEVEYEGINEEFANHASRHKRVNNLIREFAVNKPRVKLINFTDYIHDQSDYEDSINHFSRRIYYDTATQIVSYINEGVDR